MNGKRVDLCDGATEDVAGTKFDSSINLRGLSKAFTENCPPSTSYKAKYQPAPNETFCYGGGFWQDTTGYPRFY